MELGYACINMSLGKNISTNRTMRKKTFIEKGINYAAELGLQNTADLLPILEFNVKNKIQVFRMSSNFYPWVGEYKLKELPTYERIKTLLAGCGYYAERNNIRITSHPGPFNVLVSPNKDVVKRTYTDLEVHGEIFDLMGLSKTPYNKINIHCNGVYGDKKAAMDRFCKNFEGLSESVKSRLTVENDDKPAMYSVKDLMYIHERIGIPIVFDYHHHKFCTGGLSEQEALELALSTWPKDIKPIVHYSESKALHENNSKIKPQAHSDLINKLPNLYGNDVDIMVEAKGKELAILPFIK